MQARWTRHVGPLAIALVVGAFGLHRLAVILSAGDFLFPIEPWEGKNTQIAWDLFTGRYGTEGYTFTDFVTNTGAAHHASYSTTALVYLLVSKVLGFGLLGVRITPLLFWLGALAVWLWALRWAAGTPAAVMAGAGIFLVPSAVIGWQLTFFGCHSEAVLPLAAAVAAWLVWTDRRSHGWLPAAAVGVTWGYAAAFSYLLWPVLAVMGVLTLLGTRPRFDGRAIGALAGGCVVGMWPIWVIVLLNPEALFSYPVTEDAATTLADIGAGRGSTTSLTWHTFKAPFRGFSHDYWSTTARAGALWGGTRCEGLSWMLVVFAPLGLLPAGWVLRHEAMGKVALLVGTAPLACLAYVAYGSPFKPDLPLRYMLPLAFLGWSAPGLAVGVGLKLARETAPSALQRIGGWVMVGAGSVALLWVAVPRVQESAGLVRLERAGELTQHRYVTYYNLGIGTVWAEQVGEVNDLIDVRTAQGEAAGFGGMQGGLYHDLQRTGLALRTWQPLPMQSDSLAPGLHEWAERQQYTAVSQREFTPLATRNIGWGAGIRARWNAAGAALALAGARADGWWPAELSDEDFWEGYGMGWGRADDGAPDSAELMPRTIPDAYHDAVARGVRRGRSLGEVEAGRGEPVFVSFRNPAQ